MTEVTTRCHLAASSAQKSFESTVLPTCFTLSAFCPTEYFQFYLLQLSDKQLNDTPSNYGYYADSRMKAIGEYFSDLMGCGPDGWCAFKCCPPTQRSAKRYSLSSYVRPLGQSRTNGVVSSRNPVMTPTMAPPSKRVCAKACMPGCNSRCLQRYNQIVASFMNSLTAIDVMGHPVNEQSEVRLAPPKQTECRDECMPYCSTECLSAYSQMASFSPPKVCQSVCMPYCLEECVHAPPLMTPCVFTGACHCPPGYVQCSEITCCMKYKAMAIWYKNRFTSMSFSDDDQTEKGTTRGGNETTVYMNALRSMGDADDLKTPKRQLPENSTIVFYPEQGKAEILLNDGSVLVEHMSQK
ncbi:unnamed protein product [Caenorhabditis auriculariae]|uniref:Uncharacterized protein n=1 Tax=Caenorhabditis auriculariae TaxID=2777116 RepID=A0A8S1GQY8_9PELO|nr:unnamed protein product [Caenorhabditis auriculariae]